VLGKPAIIGIALGMTVRSVVRVCRRRSVSPSSPVGPPDLSAARCRRNVHAHQPAWVECRHAGGGECFVGRSHCSLVVGGRWRQCTRTQRSRRRRWRSVNVDRVGGTGALRQCSFIAASTQILPTSSTASSPSSLPPPTPLPFLSHPNHL